MLNLLVLRSTDIDRSATFYALFGISFTKHRHGTGPEHYAAEIGALVLELYPSQSLPDPALMVRLGFLIRDLDQTLSRIASLGGQLLQPAKGSPWGRRAIIADPDGYRIELTEQHTN